MGAGALALTALLVAGADGGAPALSMIDVDLAGP
jgi:hypothetical protein